MIPASQAHLKSTEVNNNSVDILIEEAINKGKYSIYTITSELSDNKRDELISNGYILEDDKSILTTKISWEQTESKLFETKLETDNGIVKVTTIAECNPSTFNHCRAIKKST